MERLLGCDPGKRTRSLATRHLDLMDMAEVFVDPARLDVADDRYDYGETRRVTIGNALGRVFTVFHAPRGPVTRLVTAWPANRQGARTL